MIPRYRVWDKQTERMHIVSGIDFNDGLVSSVNIWHEGWPWVLEPDEIVLMQLRERVDKNNIEIFESDIVKNISGGYLGTVVIEDGAFKVKAKHSTFELTDNRCSGMVVIGNIYENSELLEEQR